MQCYVYVCVSVYVFAPSTPARHSTECLHTSLVDHFIHRGCPWTLRCCFVGKPNVSECARASGCVSRVSTFDERLNEERVGVEGRSHVCEDLLRFTRESQKHLPPLPPLFQPCPSSSSSHFPHLFSFYSCCTTTTGYSTFIQTRLKIKTLIHDAWMTILSCGLKCRKDICIWYSHCLVIIWSLVYLPSKPSDVIWEIVFAYYILYLNLQKLMLVTMINMIINYKLYHAGFFPLLVIHTFNPYSLWRR